MSVQVKNPIFLFLLNWIILLVGYLGIPLLSLEGTSLSQQYILSFLVMNFHFYGVETSIFLLILSWSLSITVFGIFEKKDWKIPLYALVIELFVYLFSIILINRTSEITYNVIKIDLLRGFGFTCAIICLLYIPIVIRHFLNKKKQIKALDIVEIKPLSICPHCGKEYQSTPIICYSCSKRIIPL